MSESRARSPKTVGVLGGMGPEATADLLAKIIRSTPAQRDQDHLRIIIDCNPQVPDRTAAIHGKATSPAPVLCAGARRLASWGAQLLVIPCNTAHHYHPEISAAVSIPVLHIMRETAALIRREHPEVRQVGVLASTGTLDTGLYREALAAVGLRELVPGADEQCLVMKAIYGVKAGRVSEPRDQLRSVAAALVSAGAEAIIAGCTEVPIVLGSEDITVSYVDATTALALAAVREATSGPEPGGE